MSVRSGVRAALLVAALAAIPRLALARTTVQPGDPPASSVMPRELSHASLAQKLDTQLPLDLEFRDSDGKVVALRDLFRGKPVVLQFAYYHCPMLCPMITEGLVRSLRPLSIGVGTEFDALTVSIDDREGPQAAAVKKTKTITDYNRPASAEGWHFLVTQGDSSKRLAEAAGFEYTYDAKNDQFAHAAGVLVLTPQGKISRVLYGIDFAPKDVKLALVEASDNKIGSLVDQVLLFCFHYDPATGTYGKVALTSVRVAGLATVALIAGFVVTQLRRENSKA